MNITLERKLVRALLTLLILVCAAGAVLRGSLPAAAEAIAPEGADARVVEAATVDELLAALAPNTHILLTGSRYDLTEARDYGIRGGEHYSWSEIYDDGWELVIESVDGLVLEGKPGVEIVTVPRYACVLKFTDCRSITLQGFTAGHTVAPGYCTGAVLGLSACRDVRVEDCDLYGCGTYGLELSRCSGVHVTNTIIRDCSYGVIYADNSADVLLDGCSIHGIEGIVGLFTMSYCHDCALINSTVQNCSADSLTEFYSVRDFTLAGCEISENRFAGVFFSTPYPIIVDGCAFHDNTVTDGWYREAWQYSERAVDAEGRVYLDAELDGLTRKADVEWSAPESPVFSAAAPEVSEDGMIHVHTVDELLAAIAPNTRIYLEDGVYDLSEASAYGIGSGEYWYWMSCFDGPGLAIRGVENLSITAAGPHRARILAVPRYCEVLSFENCRGITLQGFTAGHTQPVQDFGCAGGVLSFMDCRELHVEDCSLFGCGIMGISCYSCFNGEIVHTEIYDCADGAFYFYGSRNIAMRACNLHDNGGMRYQVYDSRNITADGTEL